MTSPQSLGRLLLHKSRPECKQSVLFTMKEPKGVLLSFGLIADIQYADIEDRLNYNKTTWRRYRNSLICLREAVTCWKGKNLAFVAQLGDIIDGFNSEQNKSREALNNVLRELHKLPPRVGLVNVLGNHELYNFSKAELAESSLYPCAVSKSELFALKNSSSSISSLQTERETKGEMRGHLDETKFNNNAGRRIEMSCPVLQPDEHKFYFTFSPHPQFRFVVLDTFDFSILGREESSVEYKEALHLLTNHNKNPDLDDPSGLEGQDRRFVAFNGGVGKLQLQWLETNLAAAERESQKVIIFSHVPFHPQSCDALHMLYNYQEVLDVLWKFNCVVACFYGHDHGSSHVVDHHGIHYRMIEALVETPSGSNAFATVHVKKDGLYVEGHGRLESQILKFRAE